VLKNANPENKKEWDDEIIKRFFAKDTKEFERKILKYLTYQSFFYFKIDKNFNSPIQERNLSCESALAS